MRCDVGVTRRVVHLSFLALISQFSFGCGSGAPVLAPVKGVVTVNGKTVAGVQVSFKVKDQPLAASGTTNEKGEYELTTIKPNDGAVVGENQVAIREIPKMAAGMSAGFSLEDMKSGKTTIKGPSRDMEKANKQSQNSNKAVPAKYGDHEKSGLTRTVVRGEKNVFDFDLKP